MVGKQERRYQRMITVVLALISLIMVIPLVLLVVASFTSNNEIVLHGYFQKSRYNYDICLLLKRAFLPKRTESGSIQVHLEREGTGFPCIWNHHSGNRDWNNDWRDDDTFVCVCTGT